MPLLRSRAAGFGWSIHVVVEIIDGDVQASSHKAAGGEKPIR
jgi:hypothetical protein